MRHDFEQDFLNIGHVSVVRGHRIVILGHQMDPGSGISVPMLRVYQVDIQRSPFAIASGAPLLLSHAHV
jgi:hypothetical protein